MLFFLFPDILDELEEVSYFGQLQPLCLNSLEAALEQRITSGAVEQGW